MGKLRPAVVVATLPGPMQTLLLSGIGSELTGIRPDWDDLVLPSGPGFATTGLRGPSVIRLSFLYAALESQIRSEIGNVGDDRLIRLRSRLAGRLLPGTWHHSGFVKAKTVARAGRRRPGARRRGWRRRPGQW